MRGGNQADSAAYGQVRSDRRRGRWSPSRASGSRCGRRHAKRECARSRWSVQVRAFVVR